MTTLAAETWSDSGNSDWALNQPQPRIPMLLFQGANDSTTPASICDAFAHAHAAFVTYIRVPDTEHTEAWNTDPQAYGKQVRTFLVQVLHLNG